LFLLFGITMIFCELKERMKVYEKYQSKIHELMNKINRNSLFKPILVQIYSSVQNLIISNIIRNFNSLQKKNNNINNSNINVFNIYNKTNL